MLSYFVDATELLRFLLMLFTQSKCFSYSNTPSGSMLHFLSSIVCKRFWTFMKFASLKFTRYITSSMFSLWAFFCFVNAFLCTTLLSSRLSGTTEMNLSLVLILDYFVEARSISGSILFVKRKADPFLFSAWSSTILFLIFELYFFIGSVRG